MTSRAVPVEVPPGNVHAEPDLHAAGAARFEARYGWRDGLAVELRPEAR